MPTPPSAASASASASPSPQSPPPRQPPRQSLRSIPPLVLLSFAVIHSQVYWLYSVIYHLCQNLPDRTVDFDETVRNALTKRSGRARAFSDPQQASSVVLQRRQTTATEATHLNTSTPRRRPRSTTISATTVDADAPLRRQQWVQHVHACLDEQESLDYSRDAFKRGSTSHTTIMDERLGRTRPPRWWQRTKRHLIRQDKDDETDSNNSNVGSSTLSLPATAASTPIDSSTTTTATSLLALAVTNNSLSQNIQSVSPSSCDMQHHHHDITTITNHPSLTDHQTTTTIGSQSSDTTSTSSVSSSTISIHTPKQSLDVHRVAISSSQIKQQQQDQQQQQRRPLAKVRSVFIKSQIEPEKARASQLELKRKTILGIPSRWSTSTNRDSSLSNELQPKTAKKRQSVRIKEPRSSTINSPATPSPLATTSSSPPLPPTTKKRLFSSLPIWKRKSVDR